MRPRAGAVALPAPERRAATGLRRGAGSPGAGSPGAGSGWARSRRSPRDLAEAPCGDAPSTAQVQNAGTSAQVLHGIHRPVAVWTGSRDEVFDPAKADAYLSAHLPAAPTTHIVPGADHLAVIDAAAGSVGRWIDATAANR